MISEKTENYLKKEWLKSKSNISNFSNIEVHVFSVVFKTGFSEIDYSISYNVNFDCCVEFGEDNGLQSIVTDEIYNS